MTSTAQGSVELSTVSLNVLAFTWLPMEWSSKWSSIRCSLPSIVLNHCHLSNAYNVSQVSSLPIWHATSPMSPELCKNHFYPPLATDRRKVDIRYDIRKANPSCLQTPLTPDLLRGVHFGLLTFIQCGASLVAQMVKNLPAMLENRVWSLGREDPLEKGMASHTIILAWEIPWTEEPGELQSMGPESDMTEQLTLHFFKRGHKGFWGVFCQQTPKSPATMVKEGCRVGPVTSL